MKNISILFLAFLTLLSCKEGEEKIEQKNSEDKKEVDESNMRPLMNMYGEDSTDAQGNIVLGEVNDNENVTDGIQYPEEDLGYRLGVRPDKPLVNSYGEDSMSSDGYYVYPPRDTIWDED